MKLFPTPEGRAGCDQVDAMVESVHAELEQMFHQEAKRRTLGHGVGRTVDTTSHAHRKIRLDSQKRECEAQSTFHGGRAVELAMHILYARCADRILGREFPSVDRAMIREDRRSHDLKHLYDRMLREFADRNMKDALEDAYQQALHRGIIDIYLDERLVYSFFLLPNAPFTETVKGGMIDGAEMTFDHSDGFKSLFGLSRDENSAFADMPYRTFSQFLEKSDAVYYERDINGQRQNMRMANYTARDHEYGRPYVTIGTEFFGRLAKAIIRLADEQWTWHPDFRERWHTRSNYIKSHTVKWLLIQNYNDSVELPEIRSVEEAVNEVLSFSHGDYPENYDSLHKSWKLVSKTGVQDEEVA